MPATLRKYVLIIAGAVLALDRLTKWIIEQTIPLHDSINIIPHFFKITHVTNGGAAFGLFSDSPSQYRIAFLVFFSVIALLVVSALLWRHTAGLNSTSIALSLILGGALGNLWDRVLTGHVVDFLEFYIGTYIWPDFNIADSAIVIGAAILMVEILFAPKPQKATEDPAILAHTGSDAGE
ncbi:MAG TPA: signal peptidase II [Terriglobales bacterium]|nr:signal peptidase II [Terriglobales bacterium]